MHTLFKAYGSMFAEVFTQVRAQLTQTQTDKHGGRWPFEKPI